MDILL